MLYRACDLNDAVLARRLVDYGVPLSPNIGIFSGSIWCRQDDRKYTILHRAVRNKSDLEVVNVILKADLKVCSVKDGSGWLPVEIVLKGRDREGRFLYEELPLDLLGMLFERMDPVDVESVIAACSAATATATATISRKREEDFLVLAKSLQKFKAVRSINVHLLGHGCAGKSTLRSAFRHTLPNPSRYYGYATSLFGYNTKVDHIDIENRTIGCEVETIKYDNQHWRFFDYGGQEKFHANHDRFLKLPGSLYIIVVALCDFRVKDRPTQWLLGHIKEKYTYWLRFLASMFEDNTVAEIFTLINGKSNVKVKFIEEVRAMIRAEQATWVSFGKAYSKDQLDRRHANVKPTLRFLNDEIPCLDNNRLNAVRDALNGVMVQTIVRVQNEAKMYPKILSKFDAVKAKARAEGTFPAFLSMKEFRETWLGGVVNLIGDTASPTITLKEHLKNWMLLRLQDLKEIIVINNEWVLTDDTWLSRNVLGKIMAGIKKSQEQKCLLTTQEVLKLLQKDSGNELFQSLQSSLGDLLESIGACVKVNAIRSNESGRGSKPPAETAPTTFLFFPMIKLLVDMKTIQPMKLEGRPNLVVQQIMRKFMLCDCSFSTFPPGYFEHLFADIVSMEKSGSTNTGMILDAFENALVLRCDGRKVEIIVKVEGDEFNVTVSTLTTIEDYVADTTSPFKSSAELRLSAIRGLIRKKKCPRIEEYCTHPTEENCTDLISTVVKDLHDETNRQMFYGITCLNNVELGTETLSSSVLRIITEAGLSRWPYSFVLTSEKIGQRCDDGKLSGSDISLLSYLHSVASTQWQLLTPESASSRVEDSTAAPEEPSVMWLYLVDQSTKKPITPTTSSDRYPIQIAEPGVFIKKWLYLILSSLSEMKSVHSIVEIAQLLDYPESELVEFFETVGLYVAKLSDFYNLNLPRSNYEKLSRKFLKVFQLCDLENFYVESNSEDIASLCNVHCREFRWMVDEESTRDDRQLDQKGGEGHGRMRNTSSELKLECYVWKNVRALPSPYMCSMATFINVFIFIRNTILSPEHGLKRKRQSNSETGN